MNFALLSSDFSDLRLGVHVVRACFGVVYPPEHIFHINSEEPLLCVKESRPPLAHIYADFFFCYVYHLLLLHIIFIPGLLFYVDVLVCSRFLSLI